MAGQVLTAFEAEHPAPIRDESMPRFEPYDPRDYVDDEPSIPWKRRVWLSVEISSQFPWLTISRY